MTRSSLHGELWEERDYPIELKIPQSQVPDVCQWWHLDSRPATRERGNRAVIHTRRLTRHFVSKKETVEAVPGADIDVAAGELVAFLVPTGLEVDHAADAGPPCRRLPPALAVVAGVSHHRAGAGTFQDRLRRSGHRCRLQLPGP